MPTNMPALHVGVKFQNVPGTRVSFTLIYLRNQGNKLSYHCQGREQCKVNINTRADFAVGSRVLTELGCGRYNQLPDGGNDDRRFAILAHF
jgi:hypothetical protein